MSYNPIIKSLLSSQFMISPSQIEMYSELANMYLAGNVTADFFTKDDIFISQKMALATTQSDYVVSEELYNLPSLTSDGVLIFPIIGALMKADWCGSAGTVTMRQWLAKAKADILVKSVLFFVDCPGGDVSGTDEYAEDIANFNKPKIAYVEGCLASGGMYLMCSCDSIISSSPNNIVGSIGVTQFFRDRSVANEAAGINDRYIYAKTSPEKHGGHRALENGGDESVIQENFLNPMDATFMEFVKKHRPNISQIALDGLETVASKAIADKTGLIDNIQDFGTVYANLLKTQKKTMAKINYSVEEGIISSIIEKMPSVEIFSESAEVAGLNLQLGEAQTAQESLQASLDTANARIATLEGIVGTNTTEQTQANARIATLEGIVAEKTGEVTTLQAKLSGFTNPTITTAPAAGAASAAVDTSTQDILTKKTMYVKPVVDTNNVSFVD